MAGRTDHLGPQIAPLHRLIWGACLIPLLIFQAHWEAQAGLAGLFALLAKRSGKRVSFPYFLFLAASITAFNLITPFGRVLWQVGPWALTQGALTEGLSKGVSIIGLVFISLFSVSRHLRFPGSFGGLLTRTFVYYERLLQEKKGLQPRALVISIDRLLERLYQPGTTVAEAANPPEAHAVKVESTKPFGWWLMSLVTALAMGLLLWR